MFTGLEGELTTPTAAAILVTLGTQHTHFGGTIANAGIGFGTRDYGSPVILEFCSLMIILMNMKF